MTTKLTLLALLLSLTGCSLSKPPDIPNHHWRRQAFGFALFDNDGFETASFIGGPPGGHAQACIFKPCIGACEWFENDQLALNWIGKMYKEHANEPQ